MPQMLSAHNVVVMLGQRGGMKSLAAIKRLDGTKYA